MDVQKVDSARSLIAGVMHWAVTTGGFNSETVQDVMPGAVERRFGNELPASPVEWLTDNGSCYRANETRQFARMLGLESKNTAVRSPESCQRQDYWPFFAIFNVRYWSLMLSAFRHFIITDWRGVFCQHSRFAFFL